jgi:hypothetical protein
MSTRQSVLAHLALRLAPHPENVATEALSYILQQSGAARDALRTCASTLGFHDAVDLHFSTQVSHESGARPDIAGKEQDGRVRLLIEAKFWAGLTDHQPVGYLNSLPDVSTLLLFVAPARRFEALWGELVRRSESAFGQPSSAASPGQWMRVAVHGQRRLALTTWNMLLTQILVAAESSAEATTVGDTRQLMALCDEMDTAGFLPLLSEELSSSMGRRVLEFGQLAYDLVECIVKDGLATATTARSVGHGWDGRVFHVQGRKCYLFFGADQWSRWGDSPLWLQVSKPCTDVRSVFQRARIQFRDGDFGLDVPITLPPNVDRDRVMAIALQQVLPIIELIPPVTSTSLAASADDRLGLDGPTARE